MSPPRKLDPFGTERQLAALAKWLKQRGHDVQVVLLYARGAFDEELAFAETTFSLSRLST